MEIQNKEIELGHEVDSKILEVNRIVYNCTDLVDHLREDGLTNNTEDAISVNSRNIFVF